MMKKIFVVCFMVLVYRGVNAQNKIWGKVVDEANQPLVGAVVNLSDLNKSVATDVDGNYKLSNLPNGKIKVSVSFLGYTNIVETVQLADNSMEQNIQLMPTSTETEEVVVTGGYNSTQHENAVKIETLKLNPLNIKSTPNFMEVLTKVPGVDMISKGSGVAKPVIRGLSMNDILVLDNGFRYENYQYSSHHPLGVDEFGVSQVDIIKGPASLLYGSDAIGGVVNFVKENPAQVGSVVGDYNLQLFSNSQGITNNLGIKGASDKFFGGVRFGQKSNADYLEGGGWYVPNSRFNVYSLKTNAGYSSKIGTFKVFYDYNQANLGLVEEEAFEFIPKRGRGLNVFYQQLNTHLLSTQNKLFLGQLKLEVNASYQNTELIHFGAPTLYEIQMALSTFTYEAKLYLPSTATSEYIVGTQGVNQVNANLNNRDTKLLPNATTNGYSVFALLQKTIWEKLKLQTGLRYDVKSIHTQLLGVVDSSNYRPQLSKRYGSLSGSLGATYNVNENLLLRVNVATAYRTPNLAELTSNGQHETRYEVGDATLVPERSLESDMSLHYHFSNTTLDLAGFYNRINNYIYITPTGTLTSNHIGIYQYMQNDASLYGGEAGLHYHPEAIHWLHIMGTYASVIGTLTNGDNLPFIPANKLNFEVRAEKERLSFILKPFVSLNSHSAFAQNRVAIDETPTASYSLLDLAIGGNILVYKQPISIGLCANNLFDKKYIDHLSTLKEVNYFNPGRNIVFTLHIPFGG